MSTTTPTRLSAGPITHVLCTPPAHPSIFCAARLGLSCARRLSFAVALVGLEASGAGAGRNGWSCACGCWEGLSDQLDDLYNHAHLGKPALGAAGCDLALIGGIVPACEMAVEGDSCSRHAATVMRSVDSGGGRWG